MNGLVYAPIVAALLLGTLIELESLGNHAAQRTIEYAQDTVDALDCAYEARPLTECSPSLLGEDFSEEVAQANALLKQVQEHSGQLPK